MIANIPQRIPPHSSPGTAGTFIITMETTKIGGNKSIGDI